MRIVASTDADFPNETIEEPGFGFPSANKSMRRNGFLRSCAPG